MKFLFNEAVLLLQAVSAVAAATISRAEAEALCGDLGVMEVDLDNLPAGVDPDAIRLCANAFSPKEEAAAPTGLFSVQTCWNEEPSGCSQVKNRCWKSCGVQGSGQWCWTALNGGYGDWISCSQNSQCNTNQACGIGLHCEDCGCSC